MRDGRIEQQGTPEDLYCRPATLFAAEFFGQPPINRLPGRIVRADARGTEITVGDGERIVLGPLTGAGPVQDDVVVAIRPEALTARPNGGTIALAPRAVAFVEWFGGERHARLGDGDTALVWRTTGDHPIAAGESIALHVAPEKVHVFDGEGRAVPHAALPNL
ncbi:TOBE domain-containing protein [Altererythrobacter sp. C41]|uniref:TOBE domain-containing protein n=1 Tax=Altererythrobacter sp. C41 TaxID=2806021 RepID=UPI003FCE4CFE